MSKYNGHKNYNHWNVSLWINNDERLYRAAKGCVRRTANRQQAAAAMLELLQEMGADKTPDGVRYSVSAIKAAMVGM